MKGKVVIAAFFLLGGGLWYASRGTKSESMPALPVVNNTPQPTVSEESLTALPAAHAITGLAHVGQSFNNCSSVGLMVALSHWGITETQEQIAEGTRPWNNAQGDNDDKSVTLYELADYAKNRHGMLTYVRPNGDISTLKKFIANGIPVLARTLMYPQDDIVHYRVVHAYDEAQSTVFQSDGVGGPNEPFSYDDWMHLWKDFNYSYLIIVPPAQKELAEKLLGEDMDEQGAWQRAKTRAENEMQDTPTDLRAAYNLVTALYYAGDYEGTTSEFEKIDNRLTRRKLWYQPEPIDAYFRLGNYDRVLQLASGVINDNNKSVSELYLLKGKVFESRGETAAARAEYEKAVKYNKNFQPAKDALASLGA
ncbi:MAG: C39 family peptidase [bacterium]|nr:C39 family peptidase [bacterium]